MSSPVAPMPPDKALRSIVQSAVAETFPNLTVRQAREISERVEKWLDQGYLEVRYVGPG